jgi:hypothetical protein
MMPVYKNVARPVSMNVRVTGGATPYAVTTWPNDAVAKMYYSKDGAAAVAITPSRIEPTIGGWLLSAGILTATVWNCDELRLWWEGTGIDFGELVFYPEADYSSTRAGHIDAAVSSRAAASVLSDVLADTNELQTDWVNGGRLDNILDARSSQASVDDTKATAEAALTAASQLG